VGVPGICEFDQDKYAVNEEDVVGLKCPIQQVNCHSCSLVTSFTDLSIRQHFQLDAFTRFGKTTRDLFGPHQQTGLQKTRLVQTIVSMPFHLLLTAVHTLNQSLPKPLGGSPQRLTLIAVATRTVRTIRIIMTRETFSARMEDI
jgi:hypothetical protein